MLVNLMYVWQENIHYSEKPRGSIDIGHGEVICLDEDSVYFGIFTSGFVLR